MSQVQNLITDHLDTWTQAIESKSSAGRGSSNKFTLVGIKKLRELILQMAVRGLLVPQDPSDEPASVLLEKIAAEKAKLIKDGKIKKTKPLPEISEDEKLFELPNGWEFSHIGELLNRVSNGFSGKQVEFQTDFPLTRIETISQSEINYEKTGFVESIPNEKKEYYQLCKGDILLSHINSDLHVGKTAIKKDETIIYHGTNLILLRFNNHVDSSFYNLLLNQKRLSGYFLSVAQHAIGQSSINQGIINSTTAVVPPFEEQKRIVAKVDELIALCDALEAQTLESMATHQTLVETLLGNLVNPQNAAKFDQAWSFLAQNFDVLFTTEHSIDTLKQTILQLAVMGKLVPQNPNDEPASKLLEKIATEKAQLVKDKKIKKTNPLPEITEDEKPFNLPDSWEWCRLANLLPQFQNGASSRGDKAGDEIIVLRLADIKNWQISLKETRKLVLERETIQRYSLLRGDILIIRVNGSADIVGRFISCTENYDAIYCDHFIRMRFPIDCLYADFLSLLGSSDLIRSAISDLFISTAGQKTVNQTHIGSLIVSLPPLEEQHRIVAKVDALMALCDKLKTNLQSAQTTQCQIAESIVQEALA